MTQQMVVFLIRNALITGLMIVAPLLATALLVGLTVSIFQAVTQIREATLAMIPKILACFGMVIWLLPWMLQTVVAYTSDVLQWIRVF